MANGGFEAFLLDGWDPSSLFGHMFLHGGFLHLLGNMLFLWIFGNAVCAKVGNISFPFIYLFLGFCAAVVHLVADGSPAVGASGAINGVVGMFLVWYPLNSISCFYLWGFIPMLGTAFSISSCWMILFWLVFDIWGAASTGGSTAYWAHIGGFAVGFALAVALLKIGLVEMEEDEKSLLAAINET
jgi:membrane associated rhomboid family serine protease